MGTEVLWVILCVILHCTSPILFCHWQYLPSLVHNVGLRGLIESHFIEERVCLFLLLPSCLTVGLVRKRQLTWCYD